MQYNIKLLKAIADETRLNIILSLMKKEMNVHEVVLAVKKSQPNVSIGLKKLADSELIISRKEQRNVYYKIKDKTQIEKILELIKNG